MRCRAGGFTLIETVAALLILISSLIVSSVIFARSFAYFNKVEKSTRATALARQTMEELRIEGADLNTFLAGVPSFAANTTTQGDLTVETSVVPVAAPRSVPAISLSTGTNRPMPLSFLQATVRVSWPEAPNGGIELQSLLGEPPRVTAPNPLTISGVTPNFTATLTDSAGREIPEVTYRWFTLAATGRATAIADNGFGKNVTLTTIATGNVTLRVRAVYEGQVYERELLAQAL